MIEPTLGFIVYGVHKDGLTSSPVQRTLCFLPHQRQR